MGKESFQNLNNKVWITMVLIGMTLVVYLKVARYQFINFDDGLYVFNNPNVQAPVTLQSFLWAFTTFQAANWHPLTWLSHMLDFQIFGLNAGGHHLTSLFFHLANTVLLFLVLRKMTGGLWQSGTVAALFAIHPLHVESVAQIAERKDVLSTFFCIVTLGAYFYYVKCPGILRYLWVILLFSLGLMAKPMLVTLPFILLLLDFWPLGRFSFGEGIKGQDKLVPLVQKRSKKFSLVLEKVPLLLLSAGSSLVTFYVQQSTGAVNQVLSLSPRISNAINSYICYLYKMFWPQNLSFFYVYSTSLPIWQIIGAGLILGLISLGVVWNWRRYPYLIVGWLWYIGTLVPVIGLVQVGGQAMADRYTYLPLIGIFIMITWGIPDLLVRLPYRNIVLGVMAGVFLPVLIGLSWLQVGYWKNSITLFQHAIKINNQNFKAHDLLGVALTEQGKFDKALFHFQEAKRIRPGYGPVYNNLGVALEKNGKTDEAVAQYLEALKVQPWAPDVHYNLGMIMLHQGKLQEAVLHFEVALKTNKNYAEAYNGIGVAFQQQGKIKEAISQYSKALKVMPFYPLAHYNMGTALLATKRMDEAIEHFEETLRLQPNYYKALNNLGWAQAQKGRIPEAILSFQRALAINPNLKEAQVSLRILLQKRGATP
ncbi:MAG: hypothetical protein A2Y79_04990 [Deltaproteobacteria bacterium RBG_13_43_22]|nr:MAG: hypothetical protein A2Y79_04990 [Deltaproteobacteria bacterium RBG_13_43_22]